MKRKKKSSLTLPPSYLPPPSLNPNSLPPSIPAATPNPSFSFKKSQINTSNNHILNTNLTSSEKSDPFLPFQSSPLLPSNLAATSCHRVVSRRFRFELLPHHQPSILGVHPLSDYRSTSEVYGRPSTSILGPAPPRLKPIPSSRVVCSKEGSSRPSFFSQETSLVKPSPPLPPSFKSFSDFGLFCLAKTFVACSYVVPSKRKRQAEVQVSELDSSCPRKKLRLFSFAPDVLFEDSFSKILPVVFKTVSGPLTFKPPIGLLPETPSINLKRSFDMCSFEPLLEYNFVAKTLNKKRKLSIPISPKESLVERYCVSNVTLENQSEVIEDNSKMEIIFLARDLLFVVAFVNFVGVQSDLVELDGPEPSLMKGSIDQSYPTLMNDAIDGLLRKSDQETDHDPPVYLNKEEEAANRQEKFPFLPDCVEIEVVDSEVAQSAETITGVHAVESDEGPLHALVFNHVSRDADYPSFGWNGKELVQLDDDQITNVGPVGKSAFGSTQELEVSFGVFLHILWDFRKRKKRTGAYVLNLLDYRLHLAINGVWMSLIFPCLLSFALLYYLPVFVALHPVEDLQERQGFIELSYFCGSL